MVQADQLYYKQRHEIDTLKWDNCMNKAPNGLIYAYSFYLDHMADNWDALILNDYEVVMPLTWRKKIGIHYLYQPPFTAQLGLFGKNISADLLQKFLASIPSKFRLWEFSLNQGNFYQLNAFNLFERVNYVLPMDQSYQNLYDNYRENIKRNIKKSIQNGNIISSDIDVAAITGLAKLQPNSGPENELVKFEKLYAFLKGESMAKTYGVFSNRNELLASCVFTFSHNRAYYILVGNHSNGRTLGASHALIDAFVKDHSEQNLLLDFEGSDIRNLAFFYSSFGASEEKYPAIRLNQLPWYIRWLKK
jgi:hypothetical protein